MKSVVICFLPALLICSQVQSVQPPGAVSVEFSYGFGAPEINPVQIRLENGEIRTYDRIDMKDCYPAGNPGEPGLPARPAFLLMPQGYVASSLELIDAEWFPMEGSFLPYPRQARNALDPQQDDRFIPLLPELLSSGDPYPSSPVEHLSTQFMRGYALACFNIRPVRFLPSSKSLCYLRNARIRVLCKPEPPENGRMKCRDLDADRNYVRRLIDNPGGLNSYRSETSPTADYPYVILSNNDMFHVPAAHNLVTFRNHLVDLLGYEVYPMKTEIIYDTFSGADNQEKIRNFMKLAYESYHTQYVLIAGDADGGAGGDNIVPVRLLYATTLSDPGGASIASDMYYACLDGNYNDDGDSRWGELRDGVDGDYIDVMQELSIGRLPVSNSADLNNIINKLEAFDHEPRSAWDKKALMAEEFTSAYVDPGDFKEQIRTGSRTCGLTTAGFPGDWTVWTLYEPDGNWTLEDVWDYLDSNDLFVVNHVGHGNNVSVMQLRDSDADDFTNTHYMFAFSQACYSGCFDNMTSEGSYSATDCIVEDLLNAPRGFAGFIANCRNGQGGDPFYLDGGTHLLDRCFFNAMFSDGIAAAGDILAAAKSEFATRLFLTDILYSMYELNLLGAPHMVLLHDPPPTPTPTPTATPDSSSSLRIVPHTVPLPVHPEAVFWVNAEIVSEGTYYTGRRLPLYVMLEAGGGYWFWPSWSVYPELDCEWVDIEAGSQTRTIIAEFVWPAGAGSGSARLHFAVLNEAMTAVAGDAYTFFNLTYAE